MPITTSSKSRLLIVDDEPGNIRILSNILAEDYVLSAATDAKQALDLAKNQSPDLILLDMVMPETRTAMDSGTGSPQSQESTFQSTDVIPIWAYSSVS